MMGTREAIGETEFEQQQILGYAPVEPDGSFKLHVPADTPLGLAIVDAKGRAIQTHLNWIQVRPGETEKLTGRALMPALSVAPMLMTSGVQPERPIVGGQVPSVTGGALRMSTPPMLTTPHSISTPSVMLSPAKVAAAVPNIRQTWPSTETPTFVTMPTETLP